MLKTATVTLRPETESDASFILDLFLSTREELPGWRELLPAQRTEILKSQSAHQVHHYRTTFPNAWFTIVEVNNRPAGRLYVNQTQNELRVIDISLLPEYRQNGIGTQLIKNIQAESIRTQTPILLHVEIESKARGFYTHLGFHELKSNSTHTAYVWQPSKS